MDKRYEWKMTKPWNMKRFPLNTPVIHYTRILLWPMKDLLVQEMLYGDHISFSPQWDTGQCKNNTLYMNIFCYFCIYFDELVVGYSCDVDLPVALRIQNWSYSHYALL
jgi:hypothetical protein